MAFVGFTMGAAAFEPQTDLGDTMFVGDSITHGVNGKVSWRWNFCKILIDNNIYFNEVGVNAGGLPSVGTNWIYGNGVFQNVHSAMSGEHAYEITGRIPAPSTGNNNRLDGTNINQWLNFDSSGKYHIAADTTPSTYFLLIGTNDLLSDNHEHVSEGGKYEKAKENLLGTRSGNTNEWSGTGDMDTIVNIMRKKSGEDVDIVVLTVPTWDGGRVTAGRQDDPEDYKCIREYNESLNAWGEWKGVKVVDINFGLVDVASGTGRAVRDFFPDMLHPLPQGELIIAGNVARGMGYAGRTAGQMRKDASDFSQRLGAQHVAAGKTYTQSWSGTVERGFTVDFTLGGVGNGADGGWNTKDNFSVIVGDGVHYGTLNINEAYILWGTTKLFSLDTSQLKDSLRIVYVYGNKARNLPSGFYVWMDDQLIGEALGNGDSSFNGLEIINNTGGDVSLEDLNLDYEGSWAPSPTGVTNGNPTIGGFGSMSDYGNFPGKKEWIGKEYLKEAPISLDVNNKQISNSLAGGELGCTINSGSQKSAFMNATARDKDLYVTLSGTATFQDYIGFHGSTPNGKINNTFTGDGYLRVIDLSEEITYKTFIGTTNNNAQVSINGNLYFEFSSAYATVVNGAYGNVNASIAGAYAANGGIKGTFRVVINEGSFGNIIGGSINGDARVEGVELFLNGGFYTGNIAAGGFYGRVGDRSITISGDAVSFSVLTELITAGAVPTGSKLFGTATPTGTVDGSATVTLADMTSEAAFRQWKGTLSGGQATGKARELVFAGVEMEGLDATLENFDVVVVGSSEYTGHASDVGLSDIGGAKEIQVAEGSKLTLLAAAEGEVVYGATEDEDVKNDGTIALQKGVTLRMNTEYTAKNGSTWDVDGGKLIMGKSVGGKHSVTMANGATLNVDGGQGEYTVTSDDDGNEVIVGAGTKGSFNLTMGSDSTVTVGAGSSGDWKVALGEGSSLTLGTGVTGNYDIKLAGGASLDSSAAGISGVVALAGPGVYDMKGGLAAGLKLTLPKVTPERQVVHMGSADVTLGGKNYITLSSSMQTQSGALMDTTGRLSLDKDATLSINVNDIASAVQQQGEGTYYLTHGDLSSLREAGAANRIVFDAAAAVLGWEITYGEDGAIHFCVPATPEDRNIYQSSTDNDGSSWGSVDGKSVYETVPAYSAILLDKPTTLDLSSETAPDGVESLVMHNLVGGSGSSLTVQDTDPAHNSKLTITNSISEKDKEFLKDISGGMEIEDSLTFAGNITLSQVGLEVKHENPDAPGVGTPVGAPESRFIVGGNLVMDGDRDVELTCGVLELHGSTNDLGRGEVLINGTEGQLAIVGPQAYTKLSGSVEVIPGPETTQREHILLSGGATLELCEGAEVGQGVVIGGAAPDGEAAGTLAVSGAATIARESRLRNVVLRVTEHGELHVAGAAPLARALSGSETGWAVAGLEGSGKVTATAADMEIAVAGGDRVFGGDLSAYAGTMTIKAGKHSQVFSGSGLKGNSAWNLANQAGGHLTLNLAESGNKLTMGQLDLQSDSHTDILFDLTQMGEWSGLQLTQLNIAQNAHVTIGQHEGLFVLEGDEGEVVTIATIKVSDTDASDVASATVDWQLRNIKNDDGHVYTEYDSAAGVLYLKTRVEALNSYLDFARSENAKAGALLLGGISSAKIGGDLADADVAVARLLRGENGKNEANVAEANRILSAVAGASTAVLGQAVAGDVERQLRAIRNRTTSFTGSSDREMSVWLNAESDYHKMDAEGTLPGYKVNSWGGTVGAGLNVGHGIGVGVALTAMYADLESEGPDRLKGDMDTCYVSAYAQMAHGSWRHTLVATVGIASIDAKRTVNYGEGSYTTSGNTTGSSFGALYEVGYSILLSESGATCLQPVVNIAVRHTELDAYSETGSTAALDVNARRNTTVTLGFGARLQSALDDSFWNRTCYFEGRALVKVDCGDSDGESRVALHEAGAARGTVHSVDRGSVGVELGAGLTVPVGSIGEVFVDAGAELWSGYTSVNASVGYKVAF